MQILLDAMKYYLPILGRESLWWQSSYRLSFEPNTCVVTSWSRSTLYISESTIISKTINSKLVMSISSVLRWSHKVRSNSSNMVLPVIPLGYSIFFCNFLKEQWRNLLMSLSFIYPLHYLRRYFYSNLSSLYYWLFRITLSRYFSPS